MKKVLLSLAAVGLAASVNAQVLNFGFEADQLTANPVDTANWTNYLETSSYDLESADANNGERALAVSTTGTCGTWERVVAIKNVNLEENKSYRIRFAGKGNNTVNVGLLQGDFFHDKALVNGAGSEQVSNIAMLGNSYETYSYVIWSPTKEQMQAAYTGTSGLWDGYFLRLAFNTEGSFAIDDIVIEESTVKDVVCNESVIRVDFGYNWNGLTLAANGAVVLPSDCVTVTVDGEEQDIESVEIKSDGNFYIFLEDGEIDEESEVLVSFTNPGDLKYTSAACPDGFNNPASAVCNFTAEKGRYTEESFNVESCVWEPAKLVTSNPEDESFELSEKLEQVTLTFNKKVMYEHEINGKPTAVLTGGSVNETLELVAFTDPTETITFKRPAGAADLAKGLYTVTIDNVSNEKGRANDQKYSISFEVGKVAVAEVVTSDYNYIAVNGTNGGQDPDWDLMIGGANWMGGDVKANDGSACRIMVKKNSLGQDVAAYYLCDRAGYTYLVYGLRDSATLHLPKGNIDFGIEVAGWEAATRNVDVRLETRDSVLVAEWSGTTDVQFTDGFDKGTRISTKFTLEKEGDFILKVREPDGGFTACQVIGIDIKTYEISEGETSDSQVLLDEKWSTTPDNAAPVGGSGWRIYAGGTAKVPGKDYNYSGARIFALGYKNMSKGFYGGMSGAESTDYIIYGEGGTYEEAVDDTTSVTKNEPTLHFNGGKVQISYYCSNWKTDAQNQTLVIADKNTGEVAYRRTDVVTPNPSGNRNANIEAQKVQFTNYFEAGDYTIKFFTDGEGFVGTIKLETVGSLAVQYKNLLNDALTVAKEELDAANLNENYAGTTRTALAKAISDYTNPDFHTVKEYNAAIAHLEQLVKAMSTRRSDINSYASSLEALQTTVATIDSVKPKYQALEAYAQAVELISTYAEVEAKDLEDEPLNAAVAGFKTANTRINNMMNDIIPNLYAKQIGNLLATIAAVTDSVNVVDNEDALIVIANGNNAISDDQAVAAALEKVTTAYIYKKIAAGYNFEEVDPEYEVSTPDSLDITGYVANNMFYTVGTQKTYSGSAADASYPGWNITEGTVSAIWWWTPNVEVTDDKPAINSSIKNIGSNAFKVKQDLNNLPAGVYTMTMKTADCSNIKNVSTTYEKKDTTLAWSNSFVYAAVAGQDSVKVEANYGEGQVWRNVATTYMMGIPAVTESGAYSLSMTIGADMNCYGDAAQVDDVNLYMTGKLEGFDYAAAAAAILDEVANGIEVVEREDAPVQVTYYNLNGQQSEAKQGINIKIERYADGYIIIKKVIVK